jgi:hypothetical protein
MTLPKWYSKGLTCSTCGTPVANGCKSGRCRSCIAKWLNSDPEMSRRRSDGLKRRYREDPEYRARMAKVSARNAQIAALNPEIYAKWQAIGRAALTHLHSPETRAKWRATRKQMGRTRHERHFAWCPDLALREEYRKLVKTPRNGINAAMAREMIEAKLADLNAIRSGQLDDALHWLRRITPVKKLDDGRYQYGSGTLTPGELISRAKLKGWAA